MDADSPIDAILLSSVGPTWTKVALVLARAARAPGIPWGDVDEYEVLAKRINELVAQGMLAAQGDLNEWRFCEVRRV